MKTTIDWGIDNVIDSRDIIARFDELDAEKTDLENEVTDAEEELAKVEHANNLLDEESEEEEDTTDLEDAVIAAEDELHDWITEYEDEYDLLKDIIDQGEGCSDWSCGEILIRDDYFTEYTEELIDDTCEFPTELKSNDWPWRHMTIDYKAAADELLYDYTEIDAGGYIYYIRA